MDLPIGIKAIHSVMILVSLGMISACWKAYQLNEISQPFAAGASVMFLGLAILLIFDLKESMPKK